MPLQTMPRAITAPAIPMSGMPATGCAKGSSGKTSSVAAHMLPWALANGSTCATDFA